MRRVMKDGIWVLEYAKTGAPVDVPVVSITLRGDTVTITGGSPPHEPESSGLVHCGPSDAYYPSVFGMRWIREEDRKAKELP